MVVALLAGMRATSTVLSSSFLAAALLVGASTAHAGSYVSLGFGGEPALQGELSTAASGENGGNSRVALGQRFSRVAVEASLSRFGLDSATVTAGGVHARLSFPLAGKLEAYGRLGLERIWTSDTPMSVAGDGDGLVGGLGLEYRVTAPLLGAASLWAELSEDRFTTEAGTEGGVRLWTLGASLGL